MPRACAVADWTVVLRAAEELRFKKVARWDRRAQWFVEFDIDFDITDRSLCRCIVIEGDTVRTVRDLDA